MMDKSKPGIAAMRANHEPIKLIEHILGEKDATKYRSVIDILLYTALTTRSDFCVAAGLRGANVERLH